MSVTLFPVDEIGVYHAASEVRSVAEQAIKLQQLTGVAKAINLAANTGEYVTRVPYSLLPDVIQQLETDGYTVTPVTEDAADPTSQFDISWEE